jgi:hypothetical protein
VPPDAVSKRVTIACRQVPTHRRHLYEPKLGIGEHLISEIFLLDTRGHTLKRPIGVQLGHAPVNRDVTDVGVLWRATSGSGPFWQSTECSPAGGELINFNAPGDGSFAVVSCPRTDRFQLPSLGCLHAVTLHRQVSVRMPKGAIAADIHCDVQIIQLRPESLSSPAAQADIAAATDFFRFTLSADVDFKRPLTVKLPLPVSPTADVDNITAADVAVCMTTSTNGTGSSNWTVVDGQLKLAKNSVTFDTKSLTKFCVVLVKPAGGASRAVLPRGSRLVDTMQRVELDNDAPRGDIIPFIHYAPKRWSLWIHCVRLDRVQETIANHPDMTVIKPSSLFLMPVNRTSMTGAGGGKFQSGFRGRETQPQLPQQQTTARDGELRLTDGCHFDVEVTGDVLIDRDDDDDEEEDEQEHGQQDADGVEKTQQDTAKRSSGVHRIGYNEALTDNCRRFSLVPKLSGSPNGPKVLTCILRLYPTDGACSAPSDARSNYAAVRCFDFDIPPEIVAEYFFVPPAPSPAPAEPEAAVDDADAAHARSRSTGRLPGGGTPMPFLGTGRRDAREIAETVNRLTKPTRAPTIVPKEPRVLSGRSLQCLARQLPTAGVNLAVHLDISESTITGMAFDALANGTSSADITYRVLLLWKRRASHYYSGNSSSRLLHGSSGSSAQDAQVQMLVTAVVATGNGHVADVIADHHRANKELTMDSFTAAGDDDNLTVSSLLVVPGL